MPAAAALLFGLTSACRTEGLAFRQDDRVRITSPRAHATVELPLVARWAYERFRLVRPDDTARPGEGYFAVFVDTVPPRPGRSLRSMAGGDEECARRPGCPDTAWFNAHGIYPTSKPFVRIDFLADRRPPGRRGGDDRHELTVVLVNGRGERVGEAGSTVEFFVERSDE